MVVGRGKMWGMSDTGNGLGSESGDAGEKPAKKDGRGKSPGSRRTQIKPGTNKVPGGEGCQTTETGAGALTVLPSSGTSSLYEDMLWVKDHQHSSEDRTPGQKECRAWKRRNPGVWWAKLADLEKAALSKTGQQPTTSTASSSTEPPSQSGSSLPDPGLERVKELLHPEWELVEWVAKHSKEVRTWAQTQGYQVPGYLEG